MFYQTELTSESLVSLAGVEPTSFANLATMPLYKGGVLPLNYRDKIGERSRSRTYTELADFGVTARYPSYWVLRSVIGGSVGSRTLILSVKSRI